jgi:hypothetical protein
MAASATYAADPLCPSNRTISVLIVVFTLQHEPKSPRTRS